MPSNPEYGAGRVRGQQFAGQGAGGQAAVTVGGAVAARRAVAVPAPAPPATGGAAVPVTFTYKAPGAGKVCLAGDFNGWSDTANPMTDQDGDLDTGHEAGSGQLPVQVRGRRQLEAGSGQSGDGADDGFGGKNSVLKVRRRGGGRGRRLSRRRRPPPRRRPRRRPRPAASCAVTFTPRGPGRREGLPGRRIQRLERRRQPDDRTTGRHLDARDEPGSGQLPVQVRGRRQLDARTRANPDGTDDGFGGQNSVVHGAGGQGQRRRGGRRCRRRRRRPPRRRRAPAATGELRSVEFAYTPVISGVSNVFLAGTFNDWNDAKTRMTDADNDGTYTVTLLLAAGHATSTSSSSTATGSRTRTTPNGADDGFGGQNSVLKVDASLRHRRDRAGRRQDLQRRSRARLRLLDLQSADADRGRDHRRAHLDDVEKPCRCSTASPAGAGPRAVRR